jgi:hypothetical protein
MKMSWTKREKTYATGWRLVLIIGWADIVLFALAAIALGAGYYLRSRPDWTLRKDIRSLNQGVMAFNAPPGLMPPTAERPAEYPIERAAAFWEKAAAFSSDRRLKSIAYYNLGTLIGREAYALSLPGPGQAEIDMAAGIRRLGEALRADPSNEDAKFNLELMEKAGKIEPKQEGAPGPGYSPGAVEKGY